jgi:diacylglycerol kinase (ATP)
MPAISHPHKIHLIHNPNAGAESHNKQELLEIFSTNGYVCTYFSTKSDDWKSKLNDADMVAIAGGDGTVRKVIKHILKQNKTENLPDIGILPLGTANNIAASLNIEGEPDVIVRSWKNANYARITIGKIVNEPGADFFIESFGFGAFPQLMHRLEKKELTFSGVGEDQKNEAIQFMHDVVENHPARECNLIIDGKDYSGKYIMVEIMNSPLFGPGLSPVEGVSTGDQFLDILLISENNREELQQYLIKRMNSEKHAGVLPSVRGREIAVCWNGKHAHADDKLLDADFQRLTGISLGDHKLRFLV